MTEREYREGKRVAAAQYAKHLRVMKDKIDKIQEQSRKDLKKKQKRIDGILQANKKMMSARHKKKAYKVATTSE